MNVSGNVVDCCANVNVLAPLRYCDLAGVPGYREAITMVNRAIEWAGESLHAAHSLTPFYPEPCELKFALRHAVACGVDELADALATVETRPGRKEEGVIRRSVRAHTVRQNGTAPPSPESEALSDKLLSPGWLETPLCRDQ